MSKKIFYRSIMSGIIPMSDIISAYFCGIMLHIIPMCGIITIKKELGVSSKPFKIKDLSLSVSRVLSCTVIYLALPSPTSSSDINGIPSDGQPY